MKTALIGAGVIGNVHAKTMAALGRPFDAICDIDEKKAADLAALLSTDADGARAMLIEELGLSGKRLKQLGRGTDMPWSRGRR